MDKSRKFTRNKQQKINLIVETTLSLINENGYDKLSTNHIADKAKIGIGTVYRHFPNGKSDILNEIVKRNIDKLMNLTILKQINDSNYENSLQHLVKTHLKAHRENLFLHMAIEQSALLSKEFGQDYELVLRNQIIEFVKTFKDLKIFRNIPEEKIKNKLYSIFNILESIVHRHVYIIPIFDTDEELISFLTEFMIKQFEKIGVI